jgi:LysM repeat protein
MKSQILPVKRRPASKGIFRRLSAVTRSRKQRVAASASSADLETDDGGSKISRALIIIFLIHIVAIALIFIHQRFLDGRTADSPPPAKSGTAEVVAPVAAPAAPSSLATGEKPYIVKAGDTYPRIAAAEGVDEDALRLLNKHVEVSPGLILRIPPPRTAAIEVAAVTPVHAQAPPDHGASLVDAAPVDVSGAPKARPLRSNDAADSAVHAAAPQASGKSYTVQSGDSIWRIAHRHKVNQDALLRANGISDARKIKPGMKLVIPQKENSKS